MKKIKEPIEIERLEDYRLQIANWKPQSVICNLKFLVVFILLAACNMDSKHRHGADQGGEHYTCPMHPQVVQNAPGNCPICGMNLVPLDSDRDTTAIADDLKYLLEPVNHTIVSDIQTVVPAKKQLEIRAEANGTIRFDTRRAYTIPIRYGGRIEKLYVNYNFEPVQKGQEMLEIYSPEVVTAQNELLYLMQSDSGNKQLIEASKHKLRLLGLTNAQIDRLIKTNKADFSLPIYSPYSGYVYEEEVTPALQPAGAQMPGAGIDNMGGGEMTGSSNLSAMSSQERLGIREGMYLSKGETAFKVVNTDRLWAEFNIYPQAFPDIKKGDPIILFPDFNKDLKIEAQVDFIQPYYQDGASFSKIRVYLDNSENRFKPGQLVTALFKTQSDSAWWIAATAVLDLGTKKVVFVREDEVFHPRIVRTGRSSGEWVEVVSGLSAADDIARNGHFMVDSDGFIKIKHEKQEIYHEH